MPRSWGHSLPRKHRKVTEGGAGGEPWQEGGHPVPDARPGGPNSTSPDSEQCGVQKGPRGPFPSLTIPGHISLLPCPDTWREESSHLDVPSGAGQKETVLYRARLAIACVKEHGSTASWGR